MVARGGSKSIKDKNLKKVGENSLISWRAKTALKAGCFSRLIISTDSEVIADEAMASGIEVPFMRPQHLATDTASSVDVVLHALEWLQENDGTKYNGIFLAEPSSPFCRVVDIHTAVSLFENSQADLVASVVEAKVNSIHLSEIDTDSDFSRVSNRIGQLRSGNRQQHKKQYYMNGCVYLFKPEQMIAKESIFPVGGVTKVFEMPDVFSIEIDDPLDLELARFFWASKKVDEDTILES